MEKKINIVHIITSLGLGGAERLLVDLCRSLDRDRFSVSVVAVVRGGPLEAEFQKLGIPVTVFHKKTKLGLGVIRALTKHLSKLSPDIVHTHLFGGDTWGRLAAYFAGVPVVISTEHSINKDEGPLKRLVKKILSLGTDRIIAVSRGVRAYSIDTDFISPEIIEVIYNGIDLSLFPFRGACAPQDGVRAVIVARLTEQKGYKALLQALPAIAAKVPAFSLDIIGDGPLRERLEQQLHDLGMAHRVRFLGAQPVSAQTLARYDMYIQPSLWEGLGIAAIEAQAVGVPVVTSDIPGLNEVVFDKSTGVLCDPENPDSIADAIAWTAAHPTEVAAIISRARAQAEEKFSLGAMVRAYSTLYENLAGK